MSVNNMRGVVMNAANVPLLGRVTVYGYNKYIIGTNTVSWGVSDNYMLSHIAQTFGQNMRTEVNGQLAFRCGDVAIPTFDFALLFSCFTAMTASYAELGSTVPVVTEYDSAGCVTWFGSSAVVYAINRNILIPIKSVDVQNACRNQKVPVSNFVDNRTFTLMRENLSFVIVSDKDELVLRINIIDFIQRRHPNLFDDDPTNDYIVDDPSTPWDESSPLGSLIASSMSMTSAEDTARRYKELATIDSVVVRSDLICTPTTRYNSVGEFLGSICYTDKDVIALAVNFRTQLFVYKPWFNSEGTSELCADATPSFQKFYNVTEECKRIMRFANTVSAVPLHASQFDPSMFEKVSEAFYEMKLPRLQFASTFGRIVIPEPVLLGGLSSLCGESVYCMVPVGVIGSNVIVKDADGSLSTMPLPKSDDGVTLSGRQWNLDSAFYDITGVIK